MAGHPMSVVSFRSPDTAMSKQSANRTDIDSLEEQSGRKGVTKTVRVARGDSSRSTNCGNHHPEGSTSPLEASTPTPEEMRRIAGNIAQRLRRLRLKADLQSLARFLGVSNDEISVSDVVPAQLGNVGNSQASIQKDEYQRLAHGDADLVLVGAEIARRASRSDNALNLIVGEGHGPGAVVDGIPQVAGGVLGDQPHPLRKPEQGSQALGLQPHCASGAGARVAPSCKIGRRYRLNGAVPQGGAQVTVNHPAAAECR